MKRIIMSSTTPVMKDGITNVMLNLFDNIDKDIFHIDFITINEPENSISKRIISNGSKITVVKRSIRHPFRFIKEYSDACRGYNIVHVHGNSATMFLELIAAKLAGVKIRIAHSHNTYCRYKIVDKLFRIPFLLTCNVRVACGQAAGEWLFGKKKFSIINNGIACEKFKFNKEIRDNIRGQLGFVDNKVIGHVGNFLPAKNHIFLINMFADLCKLDSSYRLLLLGNGELFEAINKYVQENRLSEYVIFAGSVDNVNDYLNAMDVVCMPSINEGLPLTLIEEQANGLTCIVSENITRDVDLTGNVDFITIDNGSSKWIEHIRRQFQETINRELYSQKAIERINIQSFNISLSVKKLQDIYDM